MNIFIAFLDCMDVFFFLWIWLEMNGFLFLFYFFMDLVRNEQVNVMASKYKKY